LLYIKAVYGSEEEQEKHAFPPLLQDVLGWSNTFRCLRTFSNYLGYLRSACYALGCDAPPVGNPALRAAMNGIAKRSVFQARDKMFIDRVMLCNMVNAVKQGWEDIRMASLWLITYIFLLRMPSEALLACKGNPSDSGTETQQTLVWREGDEICVRILRRKNRQQGSGTMRRQCTCQGSALMCAVHGLWERFWENLADGTQPWADISPGYARMRLRKVLQRLSVPDAQKYGTHAFRRGHAEDLRKRGCALSEILRAGQWKSSAFMTYLDEAALDQAGHSPCICMSFSLPIRRCTGHGLRSCGTK